MNSAERKDIHLLEDDFQTHPRLLDVLTHEGYQVSHYLDGEAGLASLQNKPPDLLLLDTHLEKIDGLTLLNILRGGIDQQLRILPIIMLSHISSTHNKVKAFDTGADGYLVKPINHLELLARIRAMWRNKNVDQTEPTNSVYRFDQLEINVHTREIRKRGKLVWFTQKEFEILLTLVMNQNKVMSLSEIVTAVWGDNAYIDAHNVRVRMVSMRKKLEDDPANPRYLQNAHGFGYKFTG